MTNEFFSPTTDKRIDWGKVEPVSMGMLSHARALANIPFVISSHYRTPEHCIEIGSKPDSAHTEIPCSAFDIESGTPTTTFHIIRGLLAAGFKRIGIDKQYKHVHVDSSPNKPQEVFFIETREVV